MLRGIHPVPHLADPGGFPEKLDCCDPGENKSMVIVFGSFWSRLTSAKSSPLLTVAYMLLYISGSPGWQTMIFVCVKSKLDLHVFSRHTRVSTAVVRNLDPPATMRDVRGDLCFRLL